MNGINEWYNVVGNIGFPIAIAIYLLIRFEKRIDTLRESIDQLRQIVRDSTRDR